MTRSFLDCGCPPPLFPAPLALDLDLNPPSPGVPPTSAFRSPFSAVPGEDRLRRRRRGRFGMDELTQRALRSRRNENTTIERAKLLDCGCPPPFSGFPS